MVKAELTGSTIKPLPTHRPWSGGSNSAPKLVIALSRLLTPLKLARMRLDAAVATELICGIADCAVFACSEDTRCRAPWAADEVAAAGCTNRAVSKSTRAEA